MVSLRKYKSDFVIAITNLNVYSCIMLLSNHTLSSTNFNNLLLRNIDNIQIAQKLKTCCCSKVLFCGATSPLLTALILAALERGLLPLADNILLFFSSEGLSMSFFFLRFSFMLSIFSGVPGNSATP